MHFLTTVGAIFEFLCSVAPLSLAESWDNCGLLCGEKNKPVRKALISLDITSAVAREAYEKGAELIISHHPVIFKPLSAIREGSAVWTLANRSLSAICMHTNLDLCAGGVNDALAERLSLARVHLLDEAGRVYYKKIVSFVPAPYADSVRLAMAEAGAGKLGNYDSCSFTAAGNGHFRPLEGSHPFIGKQGETEKADEVRIEAVCPANRAEQVAAAMLRAHPYEVPAYDIFTDEALYDAYGLGRAGDLPEKEKLGDFAGFVKERLGCSGVAVCDARKDVYHVAVCSGAEDGTMIEAALRAGCDTLVTGEMKHSSMIEALERGINVVAAGHFPTENVICPKLKEILASRFGEVSFEIADTNKDPMKTV